jgi:glyoxylate reductase
MAGIKPKVFVTRRIAQAGLDLLRKSCAVAVFSHNRPARRAELEKGIKGCAGLLCLLTDRIDAGLMAKAPGLKVIANYAVGVNNIELAAAHQRGIVVTNTPDVLTEATADLAWALMLSAARHVVAGDKLTRAGRFRGWDPLLLLGSDFNERTLGVIGLGRIGRAVARRAKGFGMLVLYHASRRLTEEDEAALGVEWAELETIFSESDFLTLHCPLNEKTRHLVNEKRLKKMKPGAFLINTSRGGIVDEKALVKALKLGWIRGAGLDVYENEPKLAPGLRELPQAVLLPHMGSATEETRKAMAVLAAENVTAVLRGERAGNQVNH